MTAGRMIREARKRAGLTLDQVARALGVSSGAPAHWENDRARPRVQLAAALDDLLGAGGDIVRACGYSTELLDGSPDLVAMVRRIQAQDERIAVLEAAVRVLQAGQKQLIEREISKAHRDTQPRSSKRAAAG